MSGIVKCVSENVQKWGVPYVCGWHTVYYSFTTQQILDGLNGVIQPVMDLLNDAMNQILKPLLNKLNLDIPLPVIPGLDILDTIKIQLPDTFNGIISMLDSLLNRINDFNAFMQAIEEILTEISSINSECQLNIAEE